MAVTGFLYIFVEFGRICWDVGMDGWVDQFTREPKLHHFFCSSVFVFVFEFVFVFVFGGSQNCTISSAQVSQFSCGWSVRSHCVSLSCLCSINRSVCISDRRFVLPLIFVFVLKYKLEVCSATEQNIIIVCSVYLCF